ncbi:PaaI family thioesterase [Marinobacterium jannaschii]|uniref:PaaI family thioesterase n=1 Tax=Marinobacterium jannaschii TaxID=64970 RepID=UPI0004802B80|nr:PaaI family thioesterase [Marinobacterium jannaschii]
MQDQHAFQDLIPNNHCFGCGPDNDHGLMIKSFWQDEQHSVCYFRPAPHHSAGPLGYLNGGIIATIIDCHCVCTAIAKGYQLDGREIGVGDPVWFATAQLDLSYKRPVDIESEVILLARITEVGGRKIRLECDLFCNDEVCVSARLIAIKVDAQWRSD